MQRDPLWNGIIGHEPVLRRLTRALERPAHGYLFYGPAHLGKRTIAERFVSQLLASEVSRSHPDLIILQPEEGKVTIPVDAVREARVRLAARPFVAPRVVCYVPDAERLNEEGVNALLKSVEEPPAGAVFVFVAEDATRLPATLLSRLVQLPFWSVPRNAIVDGLIASGVTKEEAERRASVARGRPGLAIEGSAISSQGADAFISAATLGMRLQIVEELSKSCESADRPVDAWGSALDAWAEAARLALLANSRVALVIGEGITAARRSIGGPISPRLALEAAALRLAMPDPFRALFPSHIPPSIPRIVLTT